MKLRLLLLLLISCFRAISQQDTTVVKELGEVFITAQRSKEFEIRIPYAVKRVSKEQLQFTVPRTTPEALQGMNGIFVQKTNHGGGSAFVRGLTGNQTLLLIDGIRLNNATYRYGPNQYLNTIDPFLINHIEVAKGTGSVQYGSDAMGGVIQLFSKEPSFSSGRPELNTTGIVKYMSSNMEKTARASLDYAAKKLALTGGITLRDFGDLIGGDTTRKQAPTGYKEWSMNLKAKWQLAPKIGVTVSHQQLRQKHVPLYHKVTLENFLLNEFDEQAHQLQYIKLEMQSKAAWINKITITGSRQQTNEGRTSCKNGSSMVRNEYDVVQTLGFTADISSRLSKYWTANSGIELYTDKVKSQTTDTNISLNTATQKRGLYPDHSSNGNYALYSLHHFKIHNWTIETGVRLNTFSIKLQDSSLGKVKITPAALVYNAGVNYAVRTNQHIYISYSTGYRAPNIDDMGTLGIVDFRYEVPAANLKPERSGNIEAGYKFHTRKWKGNVSVYYNQLNNLITRVKEADRFINGYQVYRKENTEQAFIRGAEAELTWTPVKVLEFTGNISHNYGENKTKNEPLRRIPPVNGRIMSTYKNKYWSFCLEWLYAVKQTRLAQGDKDDNRIPKGGTQGWNILNIYTSYQFKHARINTGFQNVFNKDYRTHGSGINGVGRSVWISAAWFL